MKGESMQETHKTSKMKIDGETAEDIHSDRWKKYTKWNLSRFWECLEGNSKLTKGTSMQKVNEARDEENTDH